MSRTTTPRIFVACFVILTLGLQLPFVPLATTASAADLTWDGGGASGNWSDTTNWGGNTLVSGNSIAFSGNTINNITVNDLVAGTTITGIEFLNDGNVTDGNTAEFTLSGNSITLDGNITLADITAANTTLTDQITLNIALASNTIIESSVESISGNNSTRTLHISGVISGAGRSVTKNNAGTLILSGANTFDGGFNAGDTDTVDNWIQVGVDSVGSVGSITSSAFGTGDILVRGAKISSDGTTARTLYNDITHSGGTGQSIALGDSTNNGVLTLEGAFTATGTGSRTVRVDSNVIINGLVVSGTGGSSAMSVIGTTHPGIATTGNRLTLTGNNTGLENLDIGVNGRVQLDHAGAAGSNRIDLTNSNAHLELGNGVTLTNDVRIQGAGNDKILRLTGTNNNTGTFAGDITIQETGDNNVYIFVNESNAVGTNNSLNQKLIFTGNIINTGLATTEDISIRGRGTIEFRGTNNSFNSRLELDSGAVNLLVSDADALSTVSQIQLNQSNTHLYIADGETLTVPIFYGSAGAAKRIRLTNADGTQGSGLTATLSGNITTAETVGNTEIQPRSNGGNNDPTQVLTISGDISGAGFEHNTDGVIRLTGNNTGITGTIDLSNNGSTLRLGGNNSSTGNNINLGNTNTIVQVEDGVDVGAGSTLIFENGGGSKWLEMYNGNTSLAESATFSGNVLTQESGASQARIRVTRDDTLTLTGVISSSSTLTRSGIRVDGTGTLVLTGNNTTSSGWAFGVTEDNEYNVFTMSGRQDSAFVVVNNNNALGTGTITAQGAQLQASVAGLVLPNGIYLGDANEADGYNFNVGGNHSITFGGDITLETTKNNDIGLYASSAQTFTFTGDVDMNDGSIEIHGTEGHDNARAVFSGNFTNTSTVDFFELNNDFDNSMVTLSGNNEAYNGRFLLEASNTTLFFDGGREVFGNTTAANDTQRFRLNNGGIVRSNSDVTLEAFYGIRIDGGGGKFSPDGGTTLTINGNITQGGPLTKLGSGNLVLNGTNTGATSITVEAGTVQMNGTNTGSTNGITINGGTFAANNSAAVPDTATVTLANAAGASFRLDADETIGGISGGGATGGNINLQGNTLTLVNSSIQSFSGNIIGTGGLTMSGSSPLTLDSNTGFTGTTAINSGSLIFETGTTHQTNVTVADGARIGGEATIGNLTLAANSIVNFDAGTSGAITVGDLNSGSTVFVDPVVSGSGNVIVFTGTYTPTVDAATDFQVLGGAARAGSFFGNTTNAITLTLAAANRTWDGNVSGVVSDIWDNGTTATWQEDDELFFTGDTVFFDDSRDAAATGNVQLGSGTNISANAITFGNTSNGATSLAYTLFDSTPGNTSTGFETISASGGGITVASNNTANISLQVGISGATNIVHNGSGTLSIGQGDLSGNATAITHTRTGSTVVWGNGTLKDATSGTVAATKVSTLLGDNATGSLIVGNGGTFDIDGDKNFKAYGTGSIVLGANNTAATLANSNNNGTSSNNDAPNAFDDEILIASNAITVDAEGRIDIDGTISSTASNITITKVNDDWLLLGGDNSAANITQINLNQGTLVSNNNNAFGAANITVSAGGVRGASNRTIGNDITITGGSSAIGGVTNNATTTFTGNLVFNANGANIDPGNGNRNVVIAGNLSGTATNIDILEGTTRITSSANITDTIRLDLGDNDPGDFARLELADGVTLNNLVRIENLDATDAGSIVLRLQGSAATGDFAGGIDIRQDDDVFDIRSQAGQTLTVSGNISSQAATDSRIQLVGDGNLSTGDGTVIFSGTNNTFETGTNITDHVTLQVGDGGANGGLGTGNVTVGANATLAFNRNDSHSVSNIISGAGTVSQIGSGSTTLTGNNTYTGTTNINNGTLVAGVADVASTSGALGNGGNVTFGGGTLQYTAATSGNTSDYSGRIKNSTSAVSLDTNGQDVTMEGVIDTSNTGGLTKLGTGNLTMTGANTYTGNTTVSAGTLFVNGSTAAGSDVIVGSGGTLSGNGTINGALTVQSGGTHAAMVPASAGILETQTFNGDVNYDSGSSVTWTLIENSTTTGFGQFDVSGGTINFGTAATGETFTFNVVLSGSVNYYDASIWGDTNSEWKIWDLTTGTIGELDLLNDNFIITLTDSGVSGGPQSSDIFELDARASDGIYLTLVTAVPEPGTFGLMGLGLLGFGWFARRRRLKATAVDDEKE